jgi:diaminopimelate decarboxylase
MNALERLNVTALRTLASLRNVEEDEGRLVDEKDTCVNFCAWELLFAYASHLKASFNHPKANHAIAIKTNPHPKVLKALVDWGFGLEAASYEELLLAKNAGIESHKLVFDSPVKTTREINLVNNQFPGITLNVNCLKELERLPPSKDCNMCIGIRLNPVVDSGADAIYNVSNDESKFGVPIR